MNDIIKFEDGKLSQQAVDFITAVETKMKALKEQYDQFKNDLLTVMEQNGIIKIESDNVTINYIAETTRETFDSKKFGEDFPDLYDEYIKFTKVKASVRVKVN
jgi:regulator of replication initiation timing